MKNKKLFFLLIFPLIILVIFYHKQIYVFAVEQKCTSEANELKRSLNEHYKREGRPFFGGITPEMVYEGCMKRYGLN